MWVYAAKMFTLVRLLFLPVKVGVGVSRVGAKAGYRTGRLLGYRRVAVFAAGVGLGLMIAPMAGRETRGRIQDRWINRNNGGADLAERVREELARAPRTWHLPQPEVEAVGACAILRGEVPHQSARADMERAAAAVAGVASVENHLTVGRVSGTNGLG